jgi:hypothetical protein
MAVKFWVAPSVAYVRQNGADTQVSVSPLSKATAVDASIDDDDRIDIANPASLWRLKATAPTVTTSHGAITSVKLHARIYMSNTGTFSWDFSSYDAFVAPYIKPSGLTRKWSLPNWVNIPAQTFVGHSFQNGHNFNQSIDPGAFAITWDVTGLYTWGSDNTLLSSCEFGLAMDEEDLYSEVGFFSNAGWMPIDGPAGSTPRWNISQLILEVDANDPPAPPVVTRPLMMVMG